MTAHTPRRYADYPARRITHHRVDRRNLVGWTRSLPVAVLPVRAQGRLVGAWLQLGSRAVIILARRP